MEVSIEITNQEQYTRLVKRVELDNLKAESSDIFSGAIQVITNEDTVVPFYGLIEANDFEDRFGFILTIERVSTFSL